MSRITLVGSVTWEITDLNGKVLRSGRSDNLVTQVGDLIYASAERELPAQLLGQPV